MSGIKRILVPIDGSPHSLKALNIASTIARAHKAELALLLVTYFAPDTDDIDAEETWLGDTPLIKSVKRYSESVFDDAKKHIDADIHVATYHLNGQPEEQILRFIASQNVDLTAIACKHVSFVEHVLHGSIGRHVLEKATCPVIIVK